MTIELYSVKNIIRILLLLFLSSCISQKQQVENINTILSNNVVSFSSIENTNVGRIGSIFKELIIIIKDEEDISYLQDIEDCYMYYLKSNVISYGYRDFASVEDIFTVDTFYDEYIVYDQMTNFDFSGFSYRFSYVAQQYMIKISEVEYARFLKENTQ